MNVVLHPILSLCSGAGGLDLGVGLALSGARAVCYVEHEVTACEVLAARIADGALDDAPIWTDLHAFDGRPWRGKVVGIIGGYPCQPFSVAGKRLGTADPRHLWPSIARIIAECEPDWCFFENVGGHLRLGYFDVVRPDLERLGYRVTEGLFTAAEVGAPHQRERLFILAHRYGAGLSGERSGGVPGDGDAPRGHDANGCSTSVAHAALRGLGERGEPSRGHGQPDGGDGDVEHASRAQRARATGSGPDGERRAASRPGEGIISVADPGVRQLSEPWGRPEGRDGAGPAGANHVGNTASERPGRSGEPEQRFGGHDAMAAGFAAFPPGPSDHERWAAILRDRPDLAPALSINEEYELGLSFPLASPKAQSEVRRSPHGLADGLDLPRAARLRLTGNGVVPLAAAHAFRTLTARLGDAR